MLGIICGDSVCGYMYVCVRTLPPLSAQSNTLSSSITSPVLTHWLLQVWGFGSYSQPQTLVSISVCLSTHSTIQSMCVYIQAISVHACLQTCSLRKRYVHIGMDVSSMFLQVKAFADPLPPTPTDSSTVTPNRTPVHHNNWQSSRDTGSSSSPLSMSPLPSPTHPSSLS